MYICKVPSYGKVLRLGCRLLSTRPGGVLVVSIGNPEPQYKDTRHNVGHWIVKELHRNNVPVQYGPWTDDKAFGGEISTSSDGNIILARSIGSYMNTQGKPVAKILQRYGKDKTLLVVHDELQKELGKLQFRGPGTSARGHNGLKSIDNAIGNQYTKLSVGIGRPDKGQKDVSDYVLSKFSTSERAELEKVLEKASVLVSQVMNEDQ
jgi:PTH1 family peptidyl-tRNA hydrolase